MNLFSQWPGEAGVYQTAWMMRDLVNRTYGHPWIRERAADIIEACGRRDRKCQHAALQNWVTSRVQYVSDPRGMEALTNPVTFTERKLRSGERPFGDCDDMAIYLATLLKSIGHNPEFRIVGQKKVLHHILVVCEGDQLDPTMNLGEYPERPARAIRVPI